MVVVHACSGAFTCHCPRWYCLPWHPTFTSACGLPPNAILPKRMPIQTVKINFIPVFSLFSEGLRVLSEKRRHDGRHEVSGLVAPSAGSAAAVSARESAVLARAPARRRQLPGAVRAVSVLRRGDAASGHVLRHRDQPAGPAAAADESRDRGAAFLREHRHLLHPRLRFHQRAQPQETQATRGASEPGATGRVLRTGEFSAGAFLGF